MKKYKLFTTPTCPACPMVKEFMQEIDIEGMHINAASPEGAEEAAKYEIKSVPTVIFLHENDEVAAIAKSINEIKRCLDER